MKSSFWLVMLAVLLGLTRPASAQYLKLTTDNPTDNTRLRASGATLLTISLNTNHDKSGATQTCNSHTIACGNVGTANPLDIGAYTLTLSAVGGTVTWGAYSSANPAYVDVGSSPATNTQVEINFGRASGFDPAGLYTLGTISVTPTSGSPSVIFARGAQPINPFGFGTGFGTECDGFNFPNTYVLAAPADVCNTGDFTDADGAAAAAPPNQAPTLNPVSNMTTFEGGGCRDDQVITGSDPDGDALTFSKTAGPTFMTVTTTSPTTGNIHLAAGFNDAGFWPATVRASDGALSDSKSFQIQVVSVNRAPTLNQPANMSVIQGSTANQTITASDPDGCPLTFSAVAGPTFMTVTTVDPGTGTGTGNIHLAPGASQSPGNYPATVRASDASITNDKSLTITVLIFDGSPTLNQPTNMTVTEGNTADQVITGSNPTGAPMMFSKVSGPTFMTVTTTNPGTGSATGNIHLAPGFTDSGTYLATVQVSDGSLNNQKSFMITVNNLPRAPILTQPANMTVNEGATADQTLSASDLDGNPLTFSKTSGPTFMTVTTTTATTGNIHLAPGFLDAGTYGAMVTASDGSISDSKSLTVTVNNVNRAPTLIQPANMTVNAGSTANQTLNATDPDGDAVAFTKVSGPTYVTVTTTSPSTGNVNLAPGFSDAGTAAVTVRATDNGSPSLFNEKSFTVTVIPACRAPVLNQPSNMTVNQGATADQVITGTSADGSPITFSKVAGPTFLTVTTTNSTTGNIHLAPGFSDAGTYVATIRAAVGGVCPGSDDKSFTITVCPTGPPPSLAQPANMTVNEGATADQTLTATDPDGDPLTFSKTAGPAFMSVTTTSPGTGTATGNVHLAPGFLDRGTYNATVAVSDGHVCNGTSAKSFTITVPTPGNRCPTANPGGPYSGIVGVPVLFDGSASSDPDGDPLTYAWNFGGVGAVGAIVSHTFGAAGNYNVTLTVTDNGHGDPAQVCSDNATTVATITDACAATIFNGYDTIRLGSGKPYWFGYIQPTSSCYANTDVVTSSFVMKDAGRQISAAPSKTTVGGDKSGDGIQEIKVSFTKDDLRALFTGTGLPNGHSTVTVVIEANLVTGGKLSGSTQLDVVNNGSFTISEVAPNPLNPSATLTYTTRRAGAVRIDMFDIQGRLVRHLVDEPSLSAGLHEATIDGLGQHGEKLPSGVYYIRGVSSEGVFQHLITILK